MENTLLIGLSRQMVLERQIDVVANNVANVNTNGYKSDRSLFQEYLASGAHEDNFVGSDRRVSYVQDRASFHDFSQGATQETKNPLDVALLCVRVQDLAAHEAPVHALHAPLVPVECPNRPGQPLELGRDVHYE